MPKPMDIEILGDTVALKREQWKGHVAYISNYPGLLDEVKKYSWTYTEGKHPYLNCSVLKISLHKFVLQFLYGAEKLNEMLGKSNIIEHLDNNGLNCAYENLHILSSDTNKSKAFSIDKKKTALENGEIADIPALITDVYYSHKNKYFQLQVFFNKNLVFNNKTNRYVESFFFLYNDFDTLFIDWLYRFNCIKNEEFDINKINSVRFFLRDVPLIELREEEKDAVIIERDGKHYIVIRTEPENGPISFMNHIAYKNLEDIVE